MKSLRSLMMSALALSLSLGGALAGDDSEAQRYFTDVELVDQQGQRLRLYSDLMKDRTVIISAFFTRCQGVCPVTVSTLRKIQDWLGDRLESEVRILSLSVDSDYDTPQRMQAYAAQFKARRGWHFLSGEKENVQLALRKFGQLTERKESHPSIFLVGNLTTGLWKKAFGLADPKKIIPIVESVLSDPGPGEASKGGAR